MPSCLTVAEEVCRMTGDRCASAASTMAFIVR